MEVLLKYGITFAPIVPPIILQLVKSPVVDEFDLSRLRLMAVLSAAAPLSTDLQMAFEAKFPGVDVQRVHNQILLPPPPPAILSQFFLTRVHDCCCPPICQASFH